MPNIEIETQRRTNVVEVTAQVQRAIGDGSHGSAVNVYVPHTSASVVIQERDDPSVAVDLEMALERIVDETWPWKHIEEGNVNPWAHVRTALTASSVVIPLVSGRLGLGTYQGVFLCEFDGPKRRTIVVTTLA